LEDVATYNSGQYFPSTAVYDLAASGGGASYDAAFSGIRTTPFVGAEIDLGGCTALFVAVDGNLLGGEYVDPEDDANARSIGLLIRYGGFDYLTLGDLTGPSSYHPDMEGPLAEALADAGYNIDVLHVSHHGSRYSTGNEFVAELLPEYAVISCGNNNGYGHPNQDVLNRLNGLWWNGSTYYPQYTPVRIIYTLERGDPDAGTADNVKVVGNGSSYNAYDQGSLQITAGGDGSWFTFAAEGPNTNTIFDGPYLSDEGPLPPGTEVVINQVCPFGSPGEFVELYNSGSFPVSLDGWTLDIYSGDYTFTSSDIIPARGYYLISDTNPVDGITPDVTASINITDNGSNSFARLIDGSSLIVDTVGWKTSPFFEGTRLGTLATGQAWKRVADGVDTDDNSVDFSESSPVLGSTPPPATTTPTASPPTTPQATPTPSATPSVTPSPTCSPLFPQTEVVINQVCPFGSPGEFVELYNSGSFPVSLDGWTLDIYSGDYTFSSSDIIPARGYYLISDTDPVNGVAPDVTASINITDNGSNSFARLIDSSSLTVDTVGWKTSPLFEGTRLGTLATGKAWKRSVDGEDTDDNIVDFSESSPAPRNSSTTGLSILESGDYDGDGSDDIAVFRASSGLWAVRGVTRAYFGGFTDLPVPGDYDGDGSSDIGIFRPTSGLWAVRGVTRAYFGSSADTAIPGDYDGDSRCDIGIFRRASGLWAIKGVTRVYFGSLADTPVPGYYTGSTAGNIGVFRPESGLWALRGISRIYFGGTTDQVVPGDYDGDGTWAPAIFRPSSGLWAIRGVSRVYFGNSSDLPVPADYAGSGLDSIGIFRSSSGLWAIRGLTRSYFGAAGDLPVTR